jgi:hypothetical protein
LPLILIGMPSQVAVLLSFAVGLQLLLQHSNVDMCIGPLRYIWAVAPVHRFPPFSEEIAANSWRFRWRDFFCGVDGAKSGDAMGIPFTVRR